MLPNDNETFQRELRIFERNMICFMGPNVKQEMKKMEITRKWWEVHIVPQFGRKCCLTFENDLIEFGSKALDRIQELERQIEPRSVEVLVFHPDLMNQLGKLCLVEGKIYRITRDGLKLANWSSTSTSQVTT